MKKSNILIAVFTVLAAASAAKAEEVKVDFDGKGLSAAPAYDMDTEQSHIAPIPVEPWIDPMPGGLPSCDGEQMFPWTDFCNETPHIPLNCEQAGSGSWWWVAVCQDPVPVTQFPDFKSFWTLERRGAVSVSNSEKYLVASFSKYAQTHEDFAASALPAIVSKKAKVLFDRKGGVYAVDGNTVVRLDLAKLGKQTPSMGAQNKIAPALEVAAWAVQAGQAVYNAYQAWNEYHSENNDEQDTEETGGSGSTYHYGQGGESNYDVNKRII